MFAAALVDARLDVTYLYGAPGDSILRNYGAAPGLERFSLYAYHQWQALPWALLTAGGTYDRLEAPRHGRVLRGVPQTL